MRFVKEQFKSMKELIPAGIVLVFFQLCFLCMSLFYPFSKTIKGDTWTSKADWYDVMIGAAGNIGDEMTFGGDETIFITPIINVPWLAVITILVTVLFIVGFTLVAKYAENDKTRGNIGANLMAVSMILLLVLGIVGMFLITFWYGFWIILSVVFGASLCLATSDFAESFITKIMAKY